MNLRIVCWLLLSATSLTSYAADPLTLDQAIALALENNLVLKQARATIDERGGSLIHANRSLPSNPVLELGTGYRARPGSDTVDIGIRISQEFWIGGQGELQRVAARNRLSAAEAEYDYLQTAIAARTRRAFLDILWAQESRNTARRTFQLASKLEGYTKQRLKAGEATRLDLNTARLGTARAQNALAKAGVAVMQARARLAKLLSVEPDRLADITGVLDLEPVDLPDEAKLVNQVIARRQDLEASARNITAARKELELSRQQVIPNLTVFGFFEREGGDNYIPGIGVSLPLPVFHKYQGETQQAAARLDRNLSARDELLISIRNELSLAVAEYNTAGERVQIVSNRMLNAAEENVELAQEAFRSGKVGSPALATVQDTLLNVRDEYLEALRDLITAGMDLERITGGLVFLSGSGNNGQQEPSKANHKTGDRNNESR